MSIKSRFGNQFTGTTMESYKENDPGVNSLKHVYLNRDVKLWNPIEGTAYRIRFLPLGIQGHTYFALFVLIHFGIGPNKNSFPCLLNKKEPCPACTEMDRLKAEGMEEAAETFSPARYNLTMVEVRNAQNPDLDEGPFCFAVTNNGMNTFRSAFKDQETQGLLPIDDIESAHDVYFTKKKKVTNGKTGKYAEIMDQQAARVPTPVHVNEDKAVEILQFIVDHPLNEMLQYVEPAQIEEWIHGTANKSESTTSAPEQQQTPVTEQVPQGYPIPASEQQPQPPVAGATTTSSITPAPVAAPATPVQSAPTPDPAPSVVPNPPTDSTPPPPEPAATAAPSAPVEPPPVDDKKAALLNRLQNMKTKK